MDKDSAKPTKTRGSSALSRGHEQLRSASAAAIMIRGSRTSQDNRALEMTELLESELVYNLNSGGVKRKATEEAPDAEHRRPSSTDKESCNSKKKASTNVKQKECKKRRLTLKDNKPKTQQELSIDVLRAEFEAKYEQQHELGRGGCGCVFAGYRREDNLPVAIKCIPVDNVLKQIDSVGRYISIEVAVMLRLQEETSQPGAPVLLLDWYDLGQELILVHERPVPAKDLHGYVQDNGGSLTEQEAKIILKQLVDAAIKLQDHCIFHRDIKLENILIETGSEVPRVRLIDFGLSCFIRKRRSFRSFYGTSPHCPPELNSRGKYSAGPTTVWQVGCVLENLMSYTVAGTDRQNRRCDGPYSSLAHNLDHQAPSLACPEPSGATEPRRDVRDFTHCGPRYNFQTMGVINPKQVVSSPTTSPQDRVLGAAGYE